MPHSFAEDYYDRITAGGDRIEFYSVDAGEKVKPKKARRGFFIFQRGRKVEQVTQDPIMRGVLGQINERIIREDEWRRDQGGAQVGRGGYGMGLPQIDPGPPRGFLPSPQANEQPRRNPGGIF